ncbi:sensor histidine kinase [Edaphocola aurantiacus]|uniref:sensor histidine kinase n=1 Tax=Edaphocola aurantiacus TaxID=2601682 RepID=UPI001C952008|nr:ATP-binding protein [Edaphocola aurantiacus]
MNIKTKLLSGVGLLFALILILAATSVYYVNALKRDTHNILVDNYNTLEYGRSMLLAIDRIPIASGAAIQQLESSLDKQQQNITEQGEREVTGRIGNHIALLKAAPGDTQSKAMLRSEISELMRLNMAAIERKNDLANSTAKAAIFWISVVGTFCFLIAFVLLVNLPSNIANPIKELTESIREIAQQNYKKRVHFESSGEFGALARSFNTMAEKLEEYSESRLDKIIQAKNRIEALINNMHDPVIGIDENKIVLFANEQALSITGLGSEDMLGKQIQDIAVHNDLVRDLIRDLFVPEQEVRKPEQISIFANGKESYFDKEIIPIHITPTGEQALQFIGQVILLRNVTVFKELDFAKTNFMATVSHEFKTPIASIKMSLQLLQNKQVGTLNGEQEQLVDSIGEDTARLLKITGELLNMTQLESGKMQLSVQNINPVNVLEAAVAATRTPAAQKNIHIAIHCSEDMGMMRADAEKTSWVLTNLLTNAIRYSYEESQIELHLMEEPGFIRFNVRDTGRGIDAQYTDKIFNRYFKIPGSSKEGTGLGLAISKELMEAQGGGIAVVSDLGAGSTFSIWLPRV